MMRNLPIIRDLSPWVLLIPVAIAPDKSKKIPDEILIIFFQNMFFFFCICLRTRLEVGERAENSVDRVSDLSQISGFRDFR
jgi:hypothetical protein